MTDDVVGQVAKAAIEVAVDRISQLVSAAKAAKDGSARRAYLYLLAARESLQALEREVQDIALSVSFCDLTDRAATHQQRERIEQYLHKDRVRPLFVDTVGGLQGSLRTLSDRAASIWQWPWLRTDKKAAVEEATELLQEIVGNLETLQGPIGSGLCCNELYKLGEQLKESPPSRQAVDETVDEIRPGLVEYGYLDLRRRIVMQSEVLLGAFPRAMVDPATVSSLETGSNHSERRGS